MAFISDNSEELLRSRVEDTVTLCDKRYAPCFLGFLDEREQAIARDVLHALKFNNWLFSGGYSECERAMLCAYPDYVSVDDIEFPFIAVGFQYRSARSLSHRDFLGTLLATGIRRDTIGDILCGDGITVVFLRDEVVPYVCDQITRIGGEGVTVIADYNGELPIHKEYELRHETIASPRLDAIVKALTRCSRENAADYVRLGYIAVDHRTIDSVSFHLTAPCTLSVRGHGRFMIDQIGPETKKGRLQLLARKCI